MTVGLDQSLLTSGDFSTIKLVQGDTRPPIIASLTNRIINSATGTYVEEPIDISQATVVLKIRKVGTTTILDTITGVALPGIELENGSVSVAAPYNAVGFGGRVQFYWNQNSLSTSGDLEGEIEITFNDNRVQTVYSPIKLKVRGQF